MMVSAKVLHTTRLVDPVVRRLLRGARVETRQVTRRTVRATYVNYEYYLVRAGATAARISRHAAVLLGVEV
jgi:hypothetical protein